MQKSCGHLFLKHTQHATHTIALVFCDAALIICRIYGLYCFTVCTVCTVCTVLQSTLYTVAVYIDTFVPQDINFVNLNLL